MLELKGKSEEIEELKERINQMCNKIGESVEEWYNFNFPPMLWEQGDEMTYIEARAVLEAHEKDFKEKVKNLEIFLANLFGEEHIQFMWHSLNECNPQRVAFTPKLCVELYGKYIFGNFPF